MEFTERTIDLFFMFFLHQPWTVIKKIPVKEKMALYQEAVERGTKYIKDIIDNFFKGDKKMHNMIQGPPIPQKWKERLE